MRKGLRIFFYVLSQLALLQRASAQCDDDVALFGQPCDDRSCGVLYCNPNSITCSDFPGEGEACAAPEDAGEFEEVCSRFSDAGELFCKGGVCTREKGVKDNCETRTDRCVPGTVCLALDSGLGSKCRQVFGLGEACGDELNAACWRKGYLEEGRAPLSYTEDLVCAAGFCAEERVGGLASLCSGDDDPVCGSTGTVCAMAQDGEYRCLKVADVSKRTSCFRSEDARSIALHKCPTRYACQVPPPSTGGLAVSLGFCFTIEGVAAGQPCSLYSGGNKCLAGLTCQYVKREGQPTVQECQPAIATVT